MNIKTLKDKEKIFREAESIYNKELEEWRTRAKEISVLLNSLKYAFIDNELKNFSYRYSDTILLNVGENFVTIQIKDFENDFMGLVKINIDDFISDDWEILLKNKVENLLTLEETKKINKKREKELSELRRLQELYGVV